LYENSNHSHLSTSGELRAPIHVLYCCINFDPIYLKLLNIKNIRLSEIFHLSVYTIRKFEAADRFE